MITYKVLLSAIGICVTSGSAGTAAFMLVKHLKAPLGFVYAVSTTPTGVSIAPANAADTPKEVACLVEGSTVKYDQCSLSLATLPTTKRWVDVKELTDSLKTNLTEAEIKTTGRVFRVEVNKAFFNSLDWSNIPKKISVVERSNSPQIITTLKPIFGSMGLNFYHPKITRFLGEPDWFPNDLYTKQPLTEVLISPTHDVRCSFISRRIGNRKCTMNEFSTLTLTPDDDYGAPEKKEFDTTAGKLEYHKNYLVTFLEESDAITIKNPDRRKLRYLRKLSTNSSDYWTETYFSSWSPAILESIGSDKYLFIIN